MAAARKSPYSSRMQKRHICREACVMSGPRRAEHGCRARPENGCEFGSHPYIIHISAGRRGSPCAAPPEKNPVLPDETQAAAATKRMKPMEPTEETSGGSTARGFCRIRGCPQRLDDPATTRSRFWGGGKPFRRKGRGASLQAPILSPARFCRTDSRAKRDKRACKAGGTWGTNLYLLRWRQHFCGMAYGSPLTPSSTSQRARCVRMKSQIAACSALPLP